MKKFEVIKPYKNLKEFETLIEGYELYHTLPMEFRNDSVLYFSKEEIENNEEHFKQIGEIMPTKDLIGKILNEDCLITMSKMEDKSVDLVLTDPPYGLDYGYDTYVDTPENLKELISKVMPELLRIGERVAIFTGVHNLLLYPKSNWIMCWTWNTTGSFGRMGFNQWQPIMFYGEDIKGFGSVNGELKSDVFSFSGMGSAGYSKEKGHPCGKPINVMKKLVARLSKENDLVYDPFMGSGTTAVACKQLKRNFIGSEISKEYCEIARQRLRQGILL